MTGGAVPGSGGRPIPPRRRRGRRIAAPVAWIAATLAAPAEGTPAIGSPAAPEAPVTTAEAAADIVRLPIGEVLALRRDGRIFLLSGNGRFSFAGPIRDLWRGETLETLAALRDAAERIHFADMGLDPRTLNGVTLGHGAEEVVVFVDPRCGVCHRLIEEAAPLADKYSFRFVVIAALGAESNRLARALYCARDESDALEALRDGTLESLAQRGDCALDGYERALLLADLIGVDGVPFLVAPDGRIARGRPRDLESWLEGPR